MSFKIFIKPTTRKPKNNYNEFWDFSANMVKTTTIEEIMVEYTKQNSKKKQPQKHQQQQQKNKSKVMKGLL